MMMKVEQPPAHRLLQLEALILSLPITSPKLPPRDKVDTQASEEVVDIDDLFLPKRQCWGGHVVQLAMTVGSLFKFLET